MLATSAPYSQYFDSDGDALDGGYVWFGQPNQNPQTNPVAVFWDAAGTIPAPQPLRTLNGFIVRAGAPALVFTAADYSTTVKNKRGRLIFYAASAASYSVAAQVLALQASLADPASAANGGGMVGFDFALNYAAQTLGWGLRTFQNIRNFGPLASNGVTNDLATFQAAAASGARIIDARGVNCVVNGTVNIPSGQVWLLHGATLRMTGAATEMLFADGSSDWALLGKFTIIGDGSTVGTAKGIRIKDCRRWVVDMPTILTVRGWGIYMEPGASATLRSDHGSIRSPRIDQCYIGHEDIAGTGAEYCTIENAHVTRCTLAGIKTAAGNIVWNGGHCVDNLLDGFIVGGGANHAHGIVSNMNINHNAQFNLVCTQVVNGQSFIGCHFYGNAANTAQGAIWFDRSKGIHLLGGHLDCALYNYKDGSSGQNIIEQMYCPGGYGVARLAGANDGHDQLILRDLFGAGQYAAPIVSSIDATGASLNQPSTSYASASREASATANLVSGAATTLLWPTTSLTGSVRGNPFGIYNAANGEFTIAEPGWYTFEGNQIFSGTTINQAASFLELQVDSGSGFQAYAIYMPAPAFGGGATMSCLHRERVYIPNAGYKLRLQATITGTGTLTHGRATWRNWIELRREA